MSRSVTRFCEVALRNVYYLELSRDRACATSAHRATTAATKTRAGLASVLHAASHYFRCKVFRIKRACAGCAGCTDGRHPLARQPCTSLLLHSLRSAAGRAVAGTGAVLDVRLLPGRARSTDDEHRRPDPTNGLRRRRALVERPD